MRRPAIITMRPKPSWLIFIIGLFPTSFTSQTTASVEQLMTVRPRIEVVRDKSERQKIRAEGARTTLAPRVGAPERVAGVAPGPEEE